MIRRLVIVAAVLAGGVVTAAAQGVGLYASFLPSGQVGLIAGATTSRVALGSTAPVAWVCNAGPVDAFVTAGSLNVVAETATSFPVPAGNCASINVIGATHLAGITASGVAALSISSGTGWPSAAPIGSPAALPPVASASAEASKIVASAPAKLYAVHAVNQTATGGFLLIFDAVTAPADGAVTPKDCKPLPASGDAEIAYAPGAAFSTGVVAVVSSGAGCFTKTTGVITAFFRALAQ